VTSADTARPNVSPPAAASQVNGKAATADPPGRTQSVTAHWRHIVSAVTELAGIGALSAGFWLIPPWCGLIALGVGLMVLGMASPPRFGRRRQPR
jgi:hypothetical protein